MEAVELKTEQGTYSITTTGQGAMYPLVVVDMAAGMRRLFTVKPDGSFEMPDDLTIQEARYVIENLAPMLIGSVVKVGPV